MGDLWNDVKHALLMFRKNPAFTLAAVAALALGIGANTAIFSVVNAVLLKPLQLSRRRPHGRNRLFLPRQQILTSISRSSTPTSGRPASSTAVAAYDVAGPGFNLTGDHPEQLHGIHVTEGYFRLFGAPVILGRTFTPQEDAPNGGKVVVLSYGLWQRNFAGTPQSWASRSRWAMSHTPSSESWGKTSFPTPKPTSGCPSNFPPVTDDMNHFFQVAGRLRPGITLAQANAQLKSRPAPVPP